MRFGALQDLFSGRAAFFSPHVHSLEHYHSDFLKHFIGPHEEGATDLAWRNILLFLVGLLRVFAVVS